MASQPPSTRWDQPASAPWDEEEADSLVGSYVLIGVTWTTSDGKTVEKQGEYHGKVLSVDQRTGIVVECMGKWAGQTFTLPPTTAAFYPANPGEYRLRSTGEVVTNPDFTATWTITARVIS